MLAEKLSGSGAAAKTYIEDVFSAYPYAGNGTTQTINNGIDLLGKGGLTWVMNRGGGNNHVLQDTVRGANNYLSTNATAAQATASTFNFAFSSSGFSMNSAAVGINANAANYASWSFRKASKFFDVVTWIGDGGIKFIPHSLGTTPGMIIVKRTDSTGSWIVWHRSSAINALLLNSTAAAGATSDISSVDSTQFGVQQTTNWNANVTGATYVAYVFAHDTSTDGLIQCGSFTTDASGNASVNLGWEPQFLLTKVSSTTGGWQIRDVMRGYTADTSYASAALNPNSTAAESTGNGFAINATGFSVAGLTASTTYIYLAIRRGPMKKPTSGTQVYNAIARTGTGAAATVTGVGFPPDLVIADPRNNGGVSYASFWDRLRGATNVLLPYQTAAEAAKTDAVLSLEMDGMKVGADTTNSWVNAATTYINWFFRRYPGVFDQVCYTGDDATGRSIAHNLGVAPELIIVKNRSAVVNWTVYSAATGNTSYLTLNSTSAVGTGYTGWSSTSPTNAAFYVHGSASGVNASGNNYTAHLFATLAGISKVGSYTGNGSSQTIDCGFTAGARFVLIKRTDSTGDWYVWDSTRGIVAANDPHLSLNTTAAEVTTDDSVDPVASGFAVNQLAATNINVNGASYIFLALA